MEAFVTNLFFTILVVVTVVPAVMVVLTLNIVRAACWLLLSLSGAAGLFFFMGADFVGATQLLIYVGGTLVLVIFGVMLTATGPFTNLSSRSGDWVLSLLAGSLVFAMLAYGITQAKWQTAVVASAHAPHDAAHHEPHAAGPEHKPHATDAGHDSETAHDADEAHAESTVERSSPTTNRIGMALLGFAEKASTSPADGQKHANNVPPAPHRPSSYLLPFEIISVHLVVVLIGAAYLARAKRRRTVEA